MRLQWQQEARAKYQISLEQQQEAEAALQALAGERLAPGPQGAAAYQGARLGGANPAGAAVCGAARVQAEMPHMGAGAQHAGWCEFRLDLIHHNFFP